MSGHETIPLFRRRIVPVMTKPFFATLTFIVSSS
jgi:hypothetical protein